MNKTLWQKIYSILGFKSFYECDEYGIKYKTFYWVNKKLGLFSYVATE